MRLTHLGHACLLVDVADHRILIDPGTFSHGFADLTGLAAIVVTHQHVDHLDLEAMPALVDANPEAVVLADPESVAILSEHGVSARTLAVGDDVVLGEVTIRPVGRLHAVNHDAVPRCTNVGVVVSTEGSTALYHPGDAYDGEPGVVDVLAVPLNAPWAKVSETIDFVRRIGPSAIVPIHDALLIETGRGLYLHHVATYGGDDLTVHDLASDGEAHEV